MTQTQKAAAQGKMIEVEFDGDTYLVSPSEDWPIDAVEAAEEGRNVASIRLILGDEQFKKFRSTHSTLGELLRFNDALGAATGAGN